MSNGINGFINKSYSLFVLILLFNCSKTPRSEDHAPKAVVKEEQFITMSTTTSTQASGLLDILLPAYKKETGVGVKAIAKGTGAAIRDGQDGNVDVIFVHAIEQEKKFVQDGYGTQRYPVMHNEFVIVGPPDDPAKLKDASNAVEALKKIVEKQALFVSRGDNSGTHVKEQQLWRQTGLSLQESATKLIRNGTPAKISYIHPRGVFYHSIGQGMGKAIVYANQRRGYTLSDEGTFINYKYGQSQSISLEILCRDGEKLKNPYAAIPINPKKHPHAKYKLALGFVQWLVSANGQSLIKNYRIHGKQLFFPNTSNDESK